jgi:hypothetical protein
MFDFTCHVKLRYHLGTKILTTNTDYNYLCGTRVVRVYSQRVCSCVYAHIHVATINQSYMVYDLDSCYM